MRHHGPRASRQPGEVRASVYRLFPVLAGPALLVTAGEVAIRLLSGTFAGIGPAAVIAACAGGSLVACRLRLEALRAQPAPVPERVEDR